MNDVSQFRRKKLKAKLICSFNGAFQIRPPSGNLRYTGGETRIITLDRNIGFPKLKSKIAELIRNPNYKSQQQYSFSLIYHFSDTSADEDEQPNSMASIASDDDVSCMMDEYEQLEFFGKRYRLWIFVCNDNDNDNVCINLGEIEVINNKGRLMSNTTPLGENENCGNNVRGRVRSNEDCLRKMLLKQQMFATQSGRIRSCNDQCIIDLGSPLSCSSTNPSLLAGSHSGSMLDYMFDKDLAKLVPFSNDNVHVDLSDSRHGLLRRRFGNADPQCSCGFNRSIGVMSSPETNWMSSCCDANCETSNVEPASLSDVNRENIMPWGAESMTLRVGLTTFPCSNQLVGSVYSARSSCSGSQGGIHNHQFGSSNTRNQRVFPYDFRNNRKRLHEMRNLRNAKFDGRPWVGNFYPGFGSSSSISKQGQFMRSHYPISSKPFSDSHRQQLEGELRRTSEYVLHNETCSCSLPYGIRGNYSAQVGAGDPDDGKPTLDECPSSFDDPIPGNQSLVPPTTSENLSRGIKDTNIQVDLLTDLVTDQDEVTSQLDVNVPNSPNKQGLGLHCKIPESGTACQSLSKHQSGAHMLEESTASSVNFSLHSLSLSSLFNDMEPEKCSSISSITEALLKPQSSNLELIDEDNFSSGPQVQSSSGATYTAPEKPLKLQKGDDGEVELQLDNTSTLVVDEKEDIKKTYTRPKMIGGILAQVASIYSQLATRELQTIKNSDLEYIKELGSGTYGTVFHGKWKGSDVAVKRLKPCCFNECAVEEDRLVSDFWKEAHILGQLHHPNIVALYGVVTDGPVTNLATVTEYMVNGSLKQVLRKKDRTIDRRKRLILAMDAAFGVEYLHEKNIVHFDLKSHNFLVNMRDPHRPVCKIGDLGLSKIKKKTLVSGGVRGTIPWMAPELLNSQNMVTEKVDVYSFGIVMWELLTGEEPYANMRSHEIIGGIIEGSLRPEIPSWCDPGWRSLMERCWSSDPDARPSFTEIAKELRAMAAAMNIK